MFFGKKIKGVQRLHLTQAKTDILPEANLQSVVFIIPFLFINGLLKNYVIIILSNEILQNINIYVCICITNISYKL